MKLESEKLDAHQVIQRISELRELSLKLAISGLNAGLFEISTHESAGPPPAEYLILEHARKGNQ